MEIFKNTFFKDHLRAFGCEQNWYTHNQNPNPNQQQALTNRVHAQAMYSKSEILQVLYLISF